MAGHLPIATTTQHKSLVKEIAERLKSTSFFVKIHADKGGYFMRLNEDYRMDEEHGLKDDEVFSYVDEKGEFITEIHLNEKNEINQVYKVM